MHTVRAKTNGWTGVKHIKKGEVFTSPVLGDWMEVIGKVEEVKADKPKPSNKPKQSKKSTLKMSKK